MAVVGCPDTYQRNDRRDESVIPTVANTGGCRGGGHACVWVTGVPRTFTRSIKILLCAHKHSWSSRLTLSFVTGEMMESE